jgi:hypothetical protein
MMRSLANQPAPFAAKVSPVAFGESDIQHLTKSQSIWNPIPARDGTSAGNTLDELVLLRPIRWGTQFNCSLPPLTVIRKLVRNG